MTNYRVLNEQMSNGSWRTFWEAGRKLQSGQKVQAPPLTPWKSAQADITLAVAQVSDNLSEIEAMITKARAKRADLVALPERAVPETTLARLHAATREHSITVVVGMEHRQAAGRYNSAFVLGSDGSVLTHYDQLSATSPFQTGSRAAAMWFRVKGVPAVVTMGRDGLWSELSELAAVAGAQIHVHLDHDPASSPGIAVPIWREPSAASAMP